MSWTTVAPWWCFAAVISECFRVWGHLQLTRWCRSEYCSQYSRLAEGSLALWGSDAAGHLFMLSGSFGHTGDAQAAAGLNLSQVAHFAQVGDQWAVHRSKPTGLTLCRTLASQKLLQPSSRWLKPRCLRYLTGSAFSLPLAGA